MEKIDDVIAKKEKNVLPVEDLARQFPEFFQPVGEAVGRGENKLEFKNDELAVSFSFAEAKSHPVNKLGVFDDKGKFLDLYYLLSQLKSHRDFDIDDYYTLTDFKIKSGEAEYDLDSEIKEPLILFKKNPQPVNIEGAAYFGENVIIMDSGPSSPQGILTMMHELGHINDDKLPDDQRQLQDIKFKSFMAGGATGEMDKEKDAIILRQERTAWSYALQKMRPFLDKLNISEDGLKKYVHEMALGSHCALMSEDYED